MNKPTQDNRLAQKGMRPQSLCTFLKLDCEQPCSTAQPIQEGLRWIAAIYGSAKQTSERDNHCMALIGGRYDEQATRLDATNGTIASEAQADGGTFEWKIVNKSDARQKSTQGKAQARPASEAWNRLPWRKLENHCFHIQKRI